MKIRQWWLNKIESDWQRKSLIWLCGVRRTGKTLLAQSLPKVEYLDCELPSTRRLLQDPEAFLKGFAKQSRIVLDEIHRLNNPSQLLKIASDHYPLLKILATGSSTLGASTKFKDTLTGRKSEIWLTPMISSDLKDFGKIDLKFRLLRGGLPPYFLAQTSPERDFQEWLDSYWAKDIQELFRLERRHSFQRFLELLLTQSGGIFEATRFAAPCEISRTTVSTYLSVLEETFVAHIVRPFSSRRSTEIISAPKVYAFDTGFVCYYKGWQLLRPEDLGYLWEHFVLNELHARLQSTQVLYWRDKRGHEIDFVLSPRGQKPIAIECKWATNDFSPESLLSFRRPYPVGANFVVANDIDQPFSRTFDDISVNFVTLSGLIEALTQKQ